MVFNFYDWDDTIVLSRHAIYLSYRHALKEINGFSLTWNDFDKKLYPNANSFMAQNGFSDHEIKDAKKLKNKVYLESYWKDITLLKTEFKKTEKHLIVSNTTADVIYSLIEKLSLGNHFSHIIGADIYLGANRKPAPDLYKFAFKMIEKEFDINNDWVIIHEDSPFGMNAAMSFYDEYQDRIHNFKIIYTPQKFG